MDKISENGITVKKENKPLKRCVWPLNVIDLKAFSKKKMDDAKGMLRWESEGGHL